MGTLLQTSFSHWYNLPTNFYQSSSTFSTKYDILYYLFVTQKTTYLLDQYVVSHNASNPLQTSTLSTTTPLTNYFTLRGLICTSIYEMLHYFYLIFQVIYSRCYVSQSPIACPSSFLFLFKDFLYTRNYGSTFNNQLFGINLFNRAHQITFYNKYTHHIGYHKQLMFLST